MLVEVDDEEGLVPVWAGLERVEDLGGEVLAGGNVHGWMIISALKAEGCVVCVAPLGLKETAHMLEDEQLPAGRALPLPRAGAGGHRGNPALPLAQHFFRRQQFWRQAEPRDGADGGHDSRSGCAGRRSGHPISATDAPFMDLAQREEALKESEQHHRLLFENMWMGLHSVKCFMMIATVR